MNEPQGSGSKEPMAEPRIWASPGERGERVGEGNSYLDQRSRKRAVVIYHWNQGKQEIFEEFSNATKRSMKM